MTSLLGSPMVSEPRTFQANGHVAALPRISSYFNCSALERVRASKWEGGRRGLRGLAGLRGEADAGWELLSVQPQLRPGGPSGPVLTCDFSVSQTWVVARQRDQERCLSARK